MIIIKNNIRRRLCSFLKETLFECFLLLDGGVGVFGGACGWVGEVRRLEVFCEDPTAVGREDEDRVHLSFRGGWG